MRNIKLSKNNPIKQADAEHQRKKDILLCLANIAIDCGVFPEFCEFVLDNPGLTPEQIDDRFRMQYGLYDLISSEQAENKQPDRTVMCGLS